MGGRGLQRGELEARACQGDGLPNAEVTAVTLVLWV
jgi:hypothetical protein